MEADPVGVACGDGQGDRAGHQRKLEISCPEGTRRHRMSSLLHRRLFLAWAGRPCAERLVRARRDRLCGGFGRLWLARGGGLCAVGCCRWSVWRPSSRWSSPPASRSGGERVSGFMWWSGPPRALHRRSAGRSSRRPACSRLSGDLALQPRLGLRAPGRRIRPWTAPRPRSSASSTCRPGVSSFTHNWYAIS